MSLTIPNVIVSMENLPDFKVFVLNGCEASISISVFTVVAELNLVDL